MSRNNIEQLEQVCNDMKTLVATDFGSNEETSGNFSREERVAELESERDELVAGIVFHAY